jgi:two-component system phosphate regulon sensor histidine kinase PhoR
MQQSRRRFALSLFPYGEGRKLLLSTDVTQVELAESMRQQFVANVSHEIRTPLTVILGLIETLKNIKLSESDRVRLIAMLEDHSNRMNSLVSDLLTLSQIEGTPLPDPQEHFDLHEMLTEAIDAAGSYSRVHANQQSEPHAFTLHWKLSERLIWFKGHRSELLSAVTNLLTNAIRYSSGGSIIELTAIHLSESDFGISVQDHGIGIPPDHLPRLTERFYRVDSSRSRTTGGTGLGLSIVKHVVQRHGGSIDIRSQLGKGSTFTLVFPLTRLIQGSHQ